MMNEINRTVSEIQTKCISFNKCINTKKKFYICSIFPSATSLALFYIFENLYGITTFAGSASNHRKMYIFQLCSFDGQIPIMCCTDCEFISNTRYGINYSEFECRYKKGGKTMSVMLLIFSRCIR